MTAFEEKYHPFLNAVRSACVAFSYSPEKLKKLPKISGVYIITIVSAAKVHVLYVGCANNFYRRFINMHHRKPELDLLDRIYAQPKIHCLILPGFSKKNLKLFEEYLINELNPLLNNTPTLTYKRDSRPTNTD